ncbi:LysR family transcriptional regulator [Aestuariibacter sp. A3R04]|nr:LysR family transcriptional regulator [Aestuariibacter sp. A3R04]MBU3022532.1 LysR family transcriptional regulator [Aestuariibacter sp. A3R04]
MKVFVTVQEQGSFAGAAELLSLSAPAVTRAVAYLESSLNTRLFHRTTRRIRLTEAGVKYFSDTKRILADIDAADAQVAGIHIRPSGPLNITAPIIFGERYITPIITRFLTDFPDVSVNGFMYDRIVDLIDHNIDIAVRIGKPKDSSLYGVTVGYVGRVTCASPDYLSVSPAIDEPEALKQHSIIYPTAFKEPAVWTYYHNNKPRTIQLKPRYQCNQNLSAINAAKLGFGITRCMSYQVADELASGELVSVLTAFEDKQLPIQAVSLEGRRNQEKVKQFIRYIRQGLSQYPFLAGQ